jgi:hypothetical protein
MPNPGIPPHVKCEIRDRLRNRETIESISRSLGVCRETVSRVKRQVFRNVRKENVEFVPRWRVPQHLRDGWTTVPDQKPDWAVLMYRPAQVPEIIIGKAS